MTLKFESCFRAYLLILTVCLGWALWTVAQNAPSLPTGAIIEFSAASYRAEENSGRATITLQRLGNTTQTATAAYATRDGTAQAGVDYEANNGILTFAVGETNQSFRVRLLDGNEAEGDRSLNLVLSEANGASLGTISQGRLTILDDEREGASWLTFGLDRFKPLRQGVLGIPLWQYLASLIYVVLAFGFSRLVDYFIRKYLEKWASRTRTTFDDLVLELIRGPIKIICFVILLHIGLSVLSWPKWLEELLASALKVVVAISLTYLAVKLIDVALGYWRRRATGADDEHFNQRLLPIIRNSLKVFVLVVAFLVTAQNLGLNITGLIASLSIGGLALGLAAQDTLANLFGAVAVLVDKPFRIGDWIRVDGVDGKVESIGFRSTRVRNADGHLVTIPNKTVGNSTITNVALRPNIRTVMNIGITYDTPPEKIKGAVKILEDVFRTHPMTLDVWISFNKFADSSLNVEIVHWWNSTDYKAYLQGMHELNLKVKELFDQAEIGFAFPTRTVYVKQDGRALDLEPAASRETARR